MFDFDGVAADTEWSNSGYLRKALLEFGISVTEEERLGLVGLNDLSHIERLFDRADRPVAMEEFLKKRKEVGNTYENSSLTPMPGFVEFLKELKARGIKTGLVTSTSSRLILTALDRMKLTSLFDTIVCGDMCEKKKPDPEGYRKAMSYLEMMPEECIVIEDSPVGIRAGKTAGALVVAYRGGKIRQDVKEADLEAESYEECRGMILPFLQEPATGEK